MTICFSKWILLHGVNSIINKKIILMCNYKVTINGLWVKGTTEMVLTKHGIQHITLSKSGCTSATQSLHATTLPSADNRSSTRCTRTVSGRQFLKCCSSVSVVELGTRSPFLFPANISQVYTLNISSLTRFQLNDYMKLSKDSARS